MSFLFLLFKVFIEPFAFSQMILEIFFVYWNDNSKSQMHIGVIYSAFFLMIFHFAVEPSIYMG